MEPSQDLAAAEEFNGSESGWTTYIGSPIYNDDDEQSVDFEEYGWNNYKNNNHGNVNDNIDDDGDKLVENKDDHSNRVTYDDEDEESDDDSMASDASSGPSHLLSTKRVDNTGHGHEKILSEKRTSKKIRKRRNERMIEKEEDEEEEHSLLVTDSAASHV